MGVKRMKERDKWGYFLCAPYLIYLVFFFIIPIIFSIYLSFTKYNGFTLPVWQGFTNWVRVTTNLDLWVAIRNTLFFTVLFTPLQITFALLLALLMQKTSITTTISRMLYFLPVITPGVAGMVIFTQLFLPGEGLISKIVHFILHINMQWYLSQNWIEVMTTLVLINLWKGVGYAIVIYLAGLQSIPRDIVEAATLDGVNSWQRLRYITLPLISSTTYLVLVLTTISAVQVFEVPFLMLGPNINARFQVLNTLIYTHSFSDLKFGEASVVTWFLIMLVAGLNLIYKKFEQRWVYYE